MTVYGTGIGVYPANGTAGDEISSTYEGRHLTFPESSLAAPNALVQKGDPVVVHTAGGDIVGVALNSAAVNTDLIAIDTEGIWMLSVTAVDDWGNVAVAVGDALYIDDTDLGCAITRRIDPESNTLFGYALGSITEGMTATIAVKVHWGPSEDNILMGIITNYTEAITGRPRVRIDSDYSALTGNHNGIDIRVGRTGAGANAAIVRAIHGYAFTSGVGLENAGWCLVTGVAGLMSPGGTVINPSGFYCGIFGQVFDVAASVLTQVAHMAAGWFDWQASRLPVTRNGGIAGSERGGAEILYLTNNSQTSIDSVFHVETFTSPTEYGIRNLFTFGNQCYGGGAVGHFIRDGGTGNVAVKSGGNWKKIRVVIRENDATWTPYWMLAFIDPAE